MRYIYIYISSSFNYTMFHFGIFPSVYILANYATWRFELLDLHACVISIEMLRINHIKCAQLCILTVSLFFICN